MKGKRCRLETEDDKLAIAVQTKKVKTCAELKDSHEGKFSAQFHLTLTMISSMTSTLFSIQKRSSHFWIAAFKRTLMSVNCMTLQNKWKEARFII